MQRFETKYDLLHRAYKDAELKKGAVALLQYLVMKSNKSNCFPAVDTIAAALGCCRRTVQYNMRRLEKAGYVIRKDRWYNHQQLSNQYSFSLDVVEETVVEEKYTDDEYNKIHDFSFNKQEIPFKKSDLIRKVYQCGNLSKDQKHIMVYLIFRANKQGIMYECVSTLLQALGMSARALYRSLYSLRNMGMLKICKKQIRCHTVLLFALQRDWDGMSYEEDDIRQRHTDTQEHQKNGETRGKFIQTNNEIYHNLIFRKIATRIFMLGNKHWKRLFRILKKWLHKVLRI